MEKYQVIVVGAGNAGLSAAATCAHEGLKTLLIEKHNIVGGSAQSFRRGRFEFECSLHELSGVGTPEMPGRVRKRLESLGIHPDWRMDENLFRVIVAGKDGYDYTVPALLDPFCAWMEKQFPGSGDKVRRLFELADAAVKATDYLTSEKPNPKVMLSEHTDFMRMVSYTAREVMDALGIPPDAQKVLDTYWPYLGALPDTEDAFHYFYMLWQYVVFGPMMPAKKSPEISFAFEKVILDNGGEVWTNTEVTRILESGGEVRGVQTSDGREVYADRVICSWFPNGVMQTMEKERIPERYQKLVNSREIGLSFVTVYIGLNRTAEQLGIKDYTVFLYPSADEREVKERCRGLGIGGYVIANCLNIVIPESSPEGTSTLFFTLCVYGDEWKLVRPQDYCKKKNEMAEWALDIYEKQLGITVRPYIEEIEIATPVTFARYLNTPNGTPYGYQTKPGDSIMARTINLENETLLKGLRFCGAHAERSDGYSATIGNGNIAALQMIKVMQETK